MSFVAAVLAYTLINDDLDKYVYPMAPALVCPPIEVDTSDFPESAAWAAKAKHVVQQWYGPLTSMLATNGIDPVTGEKGRAYEPYKVIKLTFKKEISAPAWAAGGEITVSGKWITEHPDDLGMMVHELTHVIQQYRGPNTPGWLTEGIADYIRWWRYEPELHATSGRTKIDFTKAKYTDAYRTTGKWLAWTSRKYDMRLVPCLDKALRNGDDPMPVFKKLTGKTADELWAEFAKNPD